jgi:methionine-R-sulfoxide reductase
MRELTPEEKKVLLEGGTEAPFSGAYVENHESGIYRCKVCDHILFETHQQEDTKNSPPGLQGWPSFNDALPGAIKTRPDDSHGMHRTEVVCATCGSHLGHLFDDSGTATSKHYCINSICLEFEKGEKN